ncbi:MAG TPA: GGDEF domain-containing protein [Bryobacteraceae bacterium]|nr:GGDEF domain-containing protein [Bryobacteraceae bacterium]
MASSSKQLESRAGDEKSLLPAVQTLVHGIAVHAVKGELEEDRQFRARLHKISEAVSEEPSWMDAMAAADSAVTSLRDHNDKVSKYHRAHIGELRAVIQTFVSTLEDLTIAGPKLMRDLREIEKQLITAADPDAIRECKASLTQCLGEIREEAERHKQAEGGRGSQDPVTGLEGRPAAEAAITAACASDSPVCAVAVSIDRLSLYNRRYGRDVGDKVLHFFVEFVKRAFEGELALYRWTGPAIVLMRRGSPDGIQAEMRRVFDPRLQFEVESGSRSILLAIGASFLVVPMMVDSRLVVNKIDSFVAE